MKKNERSPVAAGRRRAVVFVLRSHVIEGFIICVVVAAIILMSAAFTEHFRSRGSELKRAYQQLAKRYGGQCVPGGWFSRPSVHFHYGESFVVVRQVMLDGVEHVQASLAWPDRLLEFVVGTHDAEHRVTWSRRWPALAVATELPARSHFVRGSDCAPICQLFTAGVQWQINQLWHFRNYRSLLVTLSKGMLTVQKQAMLREFVALEEFTRLVLELFDQMHLTQTVGIEFVASDQAQAIDDPQCQICGDAICHDLVFCRRCKTPHHRECWQYFGACSVYACGEREFVTPRTADPILDTRRFEPDEES